MNNGRHEKFVQETWRVERNEVTGFFEVLDHERCPVAICYTRKDARLVAAAPDMYAGNADAIITLDLVSTTGVVICANCPWEKKCKTCPMSEIFRLVDGLRNRVYAIQKEARGEE